MRVAAFTILTIKFIVNLPLFKISQASASFSQLPSQEHSVLLRAFRCPDTQSKNLSCHFLFPMLLPDAHGSFCFYHTQKYTATLLGTEIHCERSHDLPMLWTHQAGITAPGQPRQPGTNHFVPPPVFSCLLLLLITHF